jgi:hypothetical protein
MAFIDSEEDWQGLGLGDEFDDEMLNFVHAQRQRALT